jgi:ankyrin repeat protein
MGLFDFLKSKSILMIGAAKKGNVKLIEELLEKGANVNAANMNGWTALMMASKNGHTEAVKLLLEKGAKVNAVEKDGRRALLFASKSGHIEVVKLLLEKGAKVNAIDHDGYTALMMASRNGHTETAKFLLEVGASVNADNGRTLMWALQNEYIDVVKLLLEKGANANAVDVIGWTALMRASYIGRADVVKLLLEKGANVNATSEEDGYTALMFASSQGYTEIVKLLQEKSAKARAADSTTKEKRASKGFGGYEKGSDSSVVVIDNSSTSDNWLINECNFRVSVYCDEAYGSFSVDLNPGQSRRITYDVKANAYSYDRGDYSNLKYNIGQGEKWAIRKENGTVIMVKL